MKIIYKSGDVVEAQETYIAHGCNCQGKMGKGVAMGIKDKFPKAYRDYRDAYVDVGLILGDVIVSSVGTIIDKKIIFNCLTQFTYNSDPNIKNVSYDAIRKCIQKINYYFEKFETIEFVAMSKIGASLGGGDWAIISSIIEEESTKFQPVVYELEE